jgi:DNA primase
MLGRGLDVKVAELPDGQDPADLIAGGASQFKKLIGASVPVIEFLLHRIQIETSDTRKVRQRVESEIFPFVRLLPSEVERYSFGQIIAESIAVPIDVLWRSFERFEQASAHTGEARPDMRQVESIVVSGSNALLSHRTFLEASIVVLPEATRKKVELVYQSFILDGVSAPEPADLARTTFLLEQQFAKMPISAQHEELVARLNQLRVGVIRQKLSELRTSLVRDTVDDPTVETALLQEISKLESALREPGFDAGTIFG